jgi:hypothetical protein
MVLSSRGPTEQAGTDHGLIVEMSADVGEMSDVTWRPGDRARLA